MNSYFTRRYLRLSIRYFYVVVYLLGSEIIIRRINIIITYTERRKIDFFFKIITTIIKFTRFITKN